MTNDREHRLRQRIDTLRDQRDDALEQLAATRQSRRRLVQRVYELRKSRELWRIRALAETFARRK